MVSEIKAGDSVGSKSSSDGSDSSQPYVSDTSLQPSRYIRSEVISVLVGKKREEFKIYKDLLYARSPFFAAKLKECWSSNKEIHLEDEDPNAFEALVDWMFNGEWKNFDSIFTQVRTTDLRRGTDTRKISATNKLADFLMMAEAKNKLVDATIAFMKRDNLGYRFRGLRSTWEADSRQTKFCDMVMRSAVRAYCTNQQEDITELNDDLKAFPDLMLIIIKAMRDYHRKPWGHVWDDKKCSYHDHVDGNECAG